MIEINLIPVFGQRRAVGSRMGRVSSWRDIRWQHRYKDITSVSPRGRFLLDYTKFHDTVPEE
jgi:hypothetical protein